MEIKYINRKTGIIEIENPPGVGFLKFLYHNPFGEMAILPLVKRKFLSEWYGRKMNTASSVKKIKGFVNELNINIDEAQKDINEFTSFNDFFYRKLKDNARPIQEGFVSPGDGKLLAFQNIDDVGAFFVKGRKFTLSEFLGDDQLAEKYKNSSMFILRLAPNDYHRYHFPSSGIPMATKEIKGAYYSVSPYALHTNFTRVFCENKRALCQFQTEDKGEILIVPVAATMVGSMIDTYTPNQLVQKGSEMGYFAFGGSTVVLLINKDKIVIDQDIIDNTQKGIETFVQMGEKIAQ